jgi:hypothetical protein
MKRSVISPNATYTFTDYFKLGAEVKDVLADFGYSFERRACELPHTARSLDRLDDLRGRIEASLPYLNLTSEVARREFLISPVLLEVVLYTHAEIRVEAPVQVSAQLQGTLDYLLEAESNLLVVEAKNADMTRGFTQLAVELVAMEQWTESQAPELYGAVSVGDIWQFGILDREAKRVTQDLNLYRVPADLNDLMSILVGILVG